MSMTSNRASARRRNRNTPMGPTVSSSHAGAAGSARHVNFLIDAHHIGGRQTGNETWIRNILRELAKDSADVLTVATFESGVDEIEALTGHRPLVVAPTAVR